MTENIIGVYYGEEDQEYLMTGYQYSPKFWNENISISVKQTTLISQAGYFYIAKLRVKCKGEDHKRDYNTC